jgi:hypothetical protein
VSVMSRPDIAVGFGTTSWWTSRLPTPKQPGC